MTDDRPAIRGLSLRRAFGQGAAATLALRGVSLDLSAREVTLVMGPSGSGKSTLLAVLSGLLRPDSGQVLALGQDLWRLSRRERKRFRLAHSGFVFQGYNLFPALTATQQLELVLRLGEGAGRKEARRRAEAMLELLGLTKQRRLLPAQLSGGEQQRVAVGRALVKAPALCFADEPTASLDWGHGRQIVELLRGAAHERGAAVLLVAHDPRIEPYADRVVHLVDGGLAGQPSGA